MNSVMFHKTYKPHRNYKCNKQNNLNKASGPFSVQPAILQLIKTIIADPLPKLINSSVESGIYFDNLKIL